MCKRCKPTGARKMDKCMKVLIVNSPFKTLACCCGHGRYPPSIVVERERKRIFESISGIEIPRKKRFYKKDIDGYYYIPEVVGMKEIIRGMNG